MTKKKEQTEDISPAKRERIKQVGKLQADIEEAENLGKFQQEMSRGYCKKEPETCEKLMDKYICDVNFEKKVLNQACKCSVEKGFNPEKAEDTLHCKMAKDLAQKARKKEAKAETKKMQAFKEKYNLQN